MHGDLYFNFLKFPQDWDALGQYGSLVKDLGWAGLSVNPNGYLDKYAIGTAVMQVPFFVAALLIQKMQGLANSGFEPAFQFANAASAVFYLAAGSSLLCRAVAAHCGQIVGTILVLAAVLGTNAIMYGSYDGAFAHVYSYFLCCCAVSIISAPRPESTSAWKRGIVLGVVVGLAVMVRPTNLVGALAIVLLLPPRPSDMIKTVLAFAAAFIVSTLPQTGWWLLTTGSPISYSYHQEGFDFAHPHLLEFLFSVRKGVFFWSPIYLLLAAAACFAPKDRRLEAGVLIIIVAVFYYACASWDPWTFGASFGSRPAVDTLPLLVLGASLAIPSRIALFWRVVGGATLTLLLAVNLTQAWGYVVHQIQYDQTTWADYVSFWRSTLRG